MAAPDRARRRFLRDEYKRVQRQARIALIPIDAEQLQQLVTFVGLRLRTGGCDGSIRHTMTWIAGEDVDGAVIIRGLAELGGHCDCEVVLNCGPEEVFGR